MWVRLVRVFESATYTHTHSCTLNTTHNIHTQHAHFSSLGSALGFRCVWVRVRLCFFLPLEWLSEARWSRGSASWRKSSLPPPKSQFPAKKCGSDKAREVVEKGTMKLMSGEKWAGWSCLGKPGGVASPFCSQDGAGAQGSASPRAGAGGSRAGEVQGKEYEAKAPPDAATPAVADAYWTSSQDLTHITSH